MTEVTRYFMTIAEAVQLVLQAAVMANGDIEIAFMAIKVILKYDFLE